MSDRQEILALYQLLYRASIQKDAACIQTLLAPEYILIHITGLRQSGKEYIQSVCRGTLKYFSAEHEHIDITFSDATHAVVDGKSVVDAAVFGGGRHTWKLRQQMKLRKTTEGWIITESAASTY